MKTSLTLIAFCTTLLCADAVHASNKGGLPECKATAQHFPATGQTTSYVVGDDGDIKAGAALSYTDNGDGTITDNNTKLMWEKKGNHPDNLHYVNNTYPWTGLCLDGNTPCGTDADCQGGVRGECEAGDGQNNFPFGQTIFQWVAELNTEAFAGHTDWRLPNMKELVSIVDYGTWQPAVHPAFNTNCSDECSVLTCSCTADALYWSTSTPAFENSAAWAPDFTYGNLLTPQKTEFKPSACSA